MTIAVRTPPLRHFSKSAPLKEKKKCFPNLLIWPVLKCYFSSILTLSKLVKSKSKSNPGYLQYNMYVIRTQNKISVRFIRLLCKGFFEILKINDGLIEASS